MEVRPQRHCPWKEGHSQPLFLFAFSTLTAIRITAQQREIPLSLQTEVTFLINTPRKVPGLLHSRFFFFFFFQTVPNLHVVQGTPATVRVPRAQALPASRVLLTGFHGDPGDLAEREKTAG